MQHLFFVVLLTSIVHCYGTFYKTREGTPTGLEEYFKAVVGVTGVPGRFCTGVVISKQWVITARQCDLGSDYDPLFVIDQNCITRNSSDTCYWDTVIERVSDDNYMVTKTNFTKEYRMVGLREREVKFYCHDFIYLKIKLEWPYKVARRVSGTDHRPNICTVLSNGFGDQMKDPKDPPFFASSDLRTANVKMLDENAVCSHFGVCHRTICPRYEWNNCYAMNTYYVRYDNVSGKPLDLKWGVYHYDVGAPLFCNIDKQGWVVYGILTGMISDGVPRATVSMYELVNEYQYIYRNENWTEIRNYILI